MLSRTPGNSILKQLVMIRQAGNQRVDNGSRPLEFPAEYIPVFDIAGRAIPAPVDVLRESSKLRLDRLMSRTTGGLTPA